MQVVRRYISSAQALPDLAVLESQGIVCELRGDVAADSNPVVPGCVELCTGVADLERSRSLLDLADLERSNRLVPVAKHRKSIERYFIVALVAFIIAATAIEWLQKPIGLDAHVTGLRMALTFGLVVGLFCAVVDL